MNGITLIALIITIIVMLILATVSITLAINGGLFSKAGEATKKANNSLTGEQTEIAGLGDYINSKVEQSMRISTRSRVSITNY